MQRPLYATLDDLQRELSQLNTTNEADQQGIDPAHGLTLLETVSRRCDLILSPKREVWFGPISETRNVKLDGLHYSSTRRRITLSYPIVSIEDAAYGDTDWTDDLTVDDAQTLLFDAATSCPSASTVSNTRLELDGLWGVPDDPSDPWPLSGAVLTAAMNNSTTTLPVDAESLMGLLGTYVFAPGRNIMVDDEVMIVTSRDTQDAGEVKVLRGQLGTVAATHDSADSVRYWAYPPELTQVVARQAALLFVRRGAFQAEMLDGVGVVTYPQDLLSALHAVLTEFQL